MAFQDFEESSFSYNGIDRRVFKASPEGPSERGIVVIHEIPGITPPVAAFADRLVERGATVWMPSLVGIPGQSRTIPYLAQSVVKMCVAKEFAYWASDQTPPIAEWLRALARELSAELGGTQVGAVGMCFSGGFALAMAADPVVKAPVLSQPAGPVPIGAARRRSAHVSNDDLHAVVAKGCNVMGLRFTGDAAVPADRFAELHAALGPKFISVDIKSPDSAISIKRTAHSVLTEDLIDVAGHPTHTALHQVLSFFERELPASGGTASKSSD